MNSYNTDFPLDETNDLIEQKARTLKRGEKKRGRNLDERNFLSLPPRCTMDLVTRRTRFDQSRYLQRSARGPRYSRNRCAINGRTNSSRRDLSLCRNKRSTTESQRLRGRSSIIGNTLQFRELTDRYGRFDTRIDTGSECGVKSL